MERLTNEDGKKETWNLININTDNIFIKGNSDIIILKVIDKLWYYENTDLAPNEINQLKHDLIVRNKALEIMFERASCDICNGKLKKCNSKTKYCKSICIKKIINQAEKELKGE